MTEVVKSTVVPDEQAKEEKRAKEKDAVRKTVEDAAKAHDELGKKFLKEDEEERIKKVKEAENKK